MPTKKDLYQLTKEMLFAKYDGHCAFCGHKLGERWQMWHIEPNKTIVTQSKVMIANDRYDNKLPACTSCNMTRVHHCKHGTIEDFRLHLYSEFDFLRSGAMYSTIFQKMIRYGVIEETCRPIVFHFERLDQNRK